MRHGKAGDLQQPRPSRPVAGRRFIRPSEEVLPPELADEAETLLAAGFGFRLVTFMALRAARTGASIEEELLAAGIEPDGYYAALARLLDVPYLARPNPEQIADGGRLDTQLLRPDMLRLHPPGQPPLIVIAPQARRLTDLAVLLDSLPNARHAMAVTSRGALREAVWKAGETRRVRDSVTRLFETAPAHSARITLWGLQGFYAGLITAMLAFGFILAPLLTGLWLHALLSLYYCAALMLRAAAMAAPSTHARTPSPDGEEEWPVYTVMAALYRESTVAAQLVAALKRLDWPASRLDIKLVCEASDTETIEALRAQHLGSQFEIVTVPAMLPVTKPKALTYALVGARGDFTVIYDAEDRPHPGQLREAFRRFRNGPERLACLQAPLHIDNGQVSGVSALFALEYAALFRSLLPMLARAGLPLPLGGTSNHFRTDALKAVGGWDPFNMTEDADLGLRLHRLGYRSGMLSLPTVEDAPTTFKVWLNQRTRWYKGWMQTWLVMMRAPFSLPRELGLAGCLAFHLMIGGIILSSLSHPLLLVLIANSLPGIVMGRFPTGPEAMLLVIDVFNILGSYWIFRQMGMKRMTRMERQAIGWRQLALPIYWLALSFAAWRALPELVRQPFLWRKTPHSPTKKAD